MKRIWRWLLSPIVLVLALTLSHNAFAQNVQWGFSMDQAFNSYIYTNDGPASIPPNWTNLPWNNPSGWPIQGVNANSWENKRYVRDGQGATQTVTAGQSFYLSVPQSLEDGCRISNYGTRGYWRDLMVIENSSGQEAWNWNPPGGNWYSSSSTGLNVNAIYCGPGSNYSGSWGFDLTAPNVTTTTTYHAMFFAEEGQYTSSYNDNNVDGDISEITVPITVQPAPVAPTITLSANPTSLTVGQSTSLSATASSNMPGSDYIVIQNTSLGWPNLNYATSGNTSNWADYTGQTSFTVTDQGPTSPNTWDYKAYILSGPGQIVAQSNPVAVTWSAAAANPTVTLSANPTSLNTGQSTTLSATASSNMPSNDYVKIEGTDGTNYSGPAGQDAVTTTDTSYSPTTVTYTAYIDNSAGQQVAQSSPVTVTWNAPVVTTTPTITLSANPTYLPTGQTTTLTATATNVPAGDQVDISGSDGLNQSTYSSSFTTTDVQYSAITVTYYAYVIGPGGTDAAEATPVSVQWYNAAPSITISLAGTPLNPMVGQSATLTATANQPFSNAYLAGIVPVSGNLTLTTTGGSQYAPPGAGDTFLWDVASSEPGPETFQLRWAENGSGNIIYSNDVTITWQAAPTVSLTASPTQLYSGQATTLTATASENVGPTPWYIVIYDSTTGQDIQTCGSGTSCSTTVTENQATTQRFQAYIGPSGGTPASSGVQSTSPSRTVTWQTPTVSLSANPTNLPTGQATTLTANAGNLLNGQMPPGDAIKIVGTDGLQQTGPANATSDTTHDTQNAPTTVTYTAYIVNGAGQQIAASAPVSVRWTQPAPPPAASDCVPYQPGYEYANGQPTYNPQACPVPTPVNF